MGVDTELVDRGLVVDMDANKLVVDGVDTELVVGRVDNVGILVVELVKVLRLVVVAESGAVISGVNVFRAGADVGAVTSIDTEAADTIGAVAGGGGGGGLVADVLGSSSSSSSSSSVSSPGAPAPTVTGGTCPSSPRSTRACPACHSPRLCAL